MTKAAVALSTSTHIPGGGWGGRSPWLAAAAPASCTGVLFLEPACPDSWQGRGRGGGRAACVTRAGFGYKRCPCHWLLPQCGVQAVGGTPHRSSCLKSLVSATEGVGGKERRLGSGLCVQEKMKFGAPPCLPPLCLYPHTQTPGLLQ